MTLIKDIIYIIVIAGGALLSIVGIYWRFHFRIKKNSETLENHEQRINKLEKGDTKTAHKLDILQRNVVKIMERWDIEPVRDLFED